MKPNNTMKELLAKWLAMDQHGCLALDCFEGKEQGKDKKTAVPAPPNLRSPGTGLALQQDAPQDGCQMLP